VNSREPRKSLCCARAQAKIMTAMSSPPTPRRRRRLRLAPVLAAFAAALALAGCGTVRARPIAAQELAEAQTFPYFPVYWVGMSFEGQHLSAADGLKSYDPIIGDSVYYGDCVHGKGIFGGGSCLLPAQITTVIYSLHPNASLGAQRNIVVRGVPATVYDEGRSIELYSGRVAIDIFSNDFARALAAAERLRPVNAPGSASGDLPPPVYCPGLAGEVDREVARVMAGLPGRVCQSSIAEELLQRRIEGPHAPKAHQLESAPAEGY
jgi:hypothetical protein